MLAKSSKILFMYSNHIYLFEYTVKSLLPCPSKSTNFMNTLYSILQLS